jgi:hypothetical protein
MKTERSPLLDSGIALAVGTAYLYCASAAHTSGYLHELALDGDVLDRNLQQILYDGFLISFAPVLLALATYAAVRFLYSHVILPDINDALRKSWNRKYKFLKLKHRWLGKRKDSAIERREKKHSMMFAFLVAAFFVLVFSLAHFESKGRQAAALVRTKLESKSFPQHEVITVFINEQKQDLLYLTCGARNCAGIDTKTMTIQYFPQSGHSYPLPPSKAKLLAAQKNSSK